MCTLKCFLLALRLHGVRGNRFNFCIFHIKTRLRPFSFERIFLIALDISGGFGDTILNGIVPLLMLWLGIRQFAPHLSHHPLLQKGVILFLLGLFVFAFGAEVKARLTEESLEDTVQPPVAVEAECSPSRSPVQG